MKKRLRFEERAQNDFNNTLKRIEQREKLKEHKYIKIDK